MSDALFAYGSLEFDEVMRLVTGRPFAGEIARLDGYLRRTLPGYIYPGIAAAPGEAVSGTLYRDLDAECFAALHAFEGDAYRAIDVEVYRVPGHGQGPVRALTYLAIDLRADDVDALDWDPATFRARHWPEVIAECRGFRSQWLASRLAQQAAAGSSR